MPNKNTSQLDQMMKFVDGSIKDMLKQMPAPPQAEVPQQTQLPQVQAGATMPAYPFAPGVSTAVNPQQMYQYMQTALQIQNQPVRDSLAMRQMASQEQSQALTQAGQRHALNMANYEAPFRHQEIAHKMFGLPLQSAQDLMKTASMGDALQWSREDRQLQREELQTRVDLLDAQLNKAKWENSPEVRDLETQFLEARLAHTLAQARGEHDAITTQQMKVFRDTISGQLTDDTFWITDSTTEQRTQDEQLVMYATNMIVDELSQKFPGHDPTQVANTPSGQAIIREIKEKFNRRNIINSYAPERYINKVVPEPEKVTRADASKPLRQFLIQNNKTMDNPDTIWEMDSMNPDRYNQDIQNLARMVLAGRMYTPEISVHQAQDGRVYSLVHAWAPGSDSLVQIGDAIPTDITQPVTDDQGNQTQHPLFLLSQTRPEIRGGTMDRIKDITDSFADYIERIDLGYVRSPGITGISGTYVVPPIKDRNQAVHQAVQQLYPFLEKAMQAEIPEKYWPSIFGKRETPEERRQRILREGRQ